MYCVAHRILLSIEVSWFGAKYYIFQLNNNDDDDDNDNDDDGI